MYTDPAERIITAVITADFHYTLNRKSSDGIVPLMKHVPEAVRALAAQAASLKPDLFVMCGDQTVSGRKEDASALVWALKRLKDEGTHIMAAPGNHDFDHGSIAAYKEIYDPLLSADDRDPASLSSSFSTGHIMFVTMDDCSSGSIGFSPETLQWLKGRLAEAERKKQKVILFTHHNLFLNSWHSHPAMYRIPGDELLPLLKEYGVHVVFSGHQHFPYQITQEQIRELVVPMPLMPPFAFFVLKIRGSEAELETHYADLRKYGGNVLADAGERKSRENAEVRKESIRKWAYKTAGESPETEQILRLSELWFDVWENGSLAEHREQILSDPAYPAMIALMKKNAYGIWMESLLHEQLVPSPLHIEL